MYLVAKFQTYPSSCIVPHKPYLMVWDRAHLLPLARTGSMDSNPWQKLLECIWGFSRMAASLPWLSQRSEGASSPLGGYFPLFQITIHRIY